MALIFDEAELLKPCRKVEPEDTPLLEELKKRIEQEWTQCWAECCGLAANQLGVNVRFAVYLDLLDKTTKQLINPVILSAKGLRTFPGEGCLSLPYQRVQTYRYQKIVVETGMSYREVIEFDGLQAQIIQHEIDHMDGILCTQRIQRPFAKQGRNESCACGSGLKFKKCHGG